MSRFDFVCDAEVRGDLEGDGAHRHCHRCRETVHDLSRMTRTEAEALLDGQVGPICTRLQLDEDLTPVFALPRSPTTRLAVVSGALVGAAGLMAAVLAPPADVASVVDPPDATASRPGAEVMGLHTTTGDVRSRLDALIDDAVRRTLLESADDADRDAHLVVVARGVTDSIARSPKTGEVSRFLKAHEIQPGMRAFTGAVIPHDAARRRGPQPMPRRSK